jgi:hypothetical protein
VRDTPHGVRLPLRGGGTVRTLAAAGPVPPLGTADPAAWPDRVQGEEFPRGAMLLLRAGGLSEARGGGDVFFDPARRP